MTDLISIDTYEALYIAGGIFVAAELLTMTIYFLVIAASFILSGLFVQMTGMDNIGVISAIIASVISTVAIFFLTQKKAAQKKGTGNIYIGETFRLKEPMKLNQPISLNVFDLPWEAILEGDEDADVGDMVEVTSANVGQLIVAKVHN